MKKTNPASKSIDLNIQEGLDLLKTKAYYYGHYAEQLKVLELIEIIEELSNGSKGVKDVIRDARKKFGW